MIVVSRKVLIVDEEIDRALALICDAALRWSGMQMLPIVNRVVGSVQEEDAIEEFFHFEEEHLSIF